MKKSLVLALLSGVALTQVHAQFVAGDLVIDRIGDGTQTLTANGNSVFLDQYARIGGPLVNTVAIPSTGGANNALLQSGSATSEGSLSLSQNGSQLVVAGYDINYPGTTSASGASSATVPRAVATVNAAGTYAFGTASTQFSGNNIRSATLGTNGNFYAGGAINGTFILNGGGTGTVVQSQTASTRVNNYFNGGLFFSTGSATGNSGAGIYSLGASPTGAVTPTLTLATGTGSSPYDFAISPTGSTIYVSDDRSIASGGGIQRWDLNTTTGAYALSYTLGTGTGSTVGARGLAVDFSGATPLVYATTAESTLDRLISITDLGTGSAATTLETASANEVFRGLDFAPTAITAVPEPATWMASFGALGIAGLVLRARRRARLV